MIIEKKHSIYYKQNIDVGLIIKH